MHRCEKKGEKHMKKRNSQIRRICSSFLAFAMVFTTAFGGGGLTAQAEGSADEFLEVSVPNGDFESGQTAWTFEGKGTSEEEDAYWRTFVNEWAKNNTTTWYEACNHSDTAETYTLSQKVEGLVPGTYKASVEAAGGNDGGTLTAALTAGDQTVSLTPTKWDVWDTYMTDTFAVDESGACDIVISISVKDQYINLDNVKLWRQSEAGPKTVDCVQAISKKVAAGNTFTAPAQAVVLYTDGTSALFDVAWNAEELAAVDTSAAGKIFTVNGTVTVEGQAYPAVMTVEILDASHLVQNVAEDAFGSVDFNENWQFYLATRTPEVADGGFAAAGVKDAGDYTTAEIVAEDFDDLGWRTVDVPHDFSIEGEKVSSSVDSQAYLQGGLGYYRKKFTIPESMKDGRTISLDFEGVYQNSVVYLNGEEVGSYPSGYTGFALDITKKVKYGQENVLVVKVQNMSPSGRWYTGSGITRPVHLMIDNLLHFNRNGVTLSTPTLEEDYTKDKSAYLEIQADGYSDATNSNIYLDVHVYDADGKAVAQKQTEAMALNPTTAFSLSMKGTDALEIPNVQLWYPWNLGTPYLYTVKVDVYQQINGGSAEYFLADSEELEYGFRWAEVKETTNDPASGGLYVNGKYTKVQGVDLHHDSGALGAASYTDAYEREFDKLKDMGVNAYRTSHCPPSKQAIEVCRRMGILVVEEAFDGWGKAKASYDFGNFFFQEVPADWAGLKPNGYTSLPAPATNYEGAKLTWSDWVIQEMVKRDKNEPSIIAWSIGNEVRGVGSKPSWYDVAQYDLLGVNPSGMNEYTEAVRLMNNVKAADGSRYVLMGGDQQRSVPGATATWGLVNQVLDGYGLNYNTAKSVDGLINRFSIGDGTLLAAGTKTFFFESESSSQTSSRGVYLDPQFSNTGINQTPGRRGGSNYDNDFASWTMSNEYGLKKDRDRKSFIGQFIWTGFDYLGEPTPYAIYPVGVSSFGTIDTAGFPKDSFYLYQSQWVTEPMVHLLPSNWDQWHEGETVEVWVNTNQQSAELFLNGKSLGKKSFDEKETAYGKKYYETSEKTADDKTWGDSSNPGGYSSTGAVLDEGELNSGKLHLTWEVPYEPGTLEVKAYDKDGKIIATDSVTTSSVPYTIQAVADKTVLAADGSSLSYVECTVVDEDGNMVPNADDLVKFGVSGAATIVGVDNGKQESTELYKYGNTDSSDYSERSAYNGKVLVILQSGKEAGDAVLTISSDDLKPVQVALKVTEDGTGTAAEAAPVTGKEVSVDPVEITVPAGMEVTLPSAVRVHYTGNAGDYSLMRPVTWGELKDGKAEGTVDGCTLKASATVTEDAQAQTDVELATGKAEATASFTGSTKNYPSCMVDGDAGTSWTNAYSRGASVLLPANSASRRSEYVEFSWKGSQVMNQITLDFTGARGTAVPSVLEAQYWNGIAWAKVSDQVTVISGDTVTMQFKPVYAEKLRVYMENGTPYSTTGNMAVSEVSVKLSTEEFGMQALLSGGEAVKGSQVTSTVALANLPAGRAVTEISFVLDYDANVFENPAVALCEGMAGTLASEEADGKTVYTYNNTEGITENVQEFVEITLRAKADAATGSSSISLTELSAKDAAGEPVSISAVPAEFSVKDRPITGEVTYLSDLEWVSAVSGWKNVEKDKYCNGDSSGAISLNVGGAKTPFAKGLGANANSEIVYDITDISGKLEEKETLYFQAYVGIDYFKVESGATGKGDGMYFIVYGTKDGVETELYRSGLLRVESEAEHISLDITGVTKLRLVMDQNGSNSHDNGDWADAKLILVPDPDAADKSMLKAALDAAKALKAEDYTVETAETLTAAIEAAEAVYADKKATQEQVDAQTSALTAAIENLKVPGAAEYQELLKLLAEKEETLKNLQAEVEEKTQQMEALQASLSEKTASLEKKEQELDAAKKETESLKKQLEAAEGNADKLKEQLETAEGNADELREQLKAAEGNVTKLNGQLQEAQGNVATLAEEKAELADQITELNSQITVMDTSLEESKGKLAKAEEEKTTLAGQLEEAKKAAQKAEEDADKAAAELEAARKAQQAAEEALKAAQKELELAKANAANTAPTMTIKKGDTVVVSNVAYRVTNAELKQAAAFGTTKSAATGIKVADTVVINGVTCTVTSIAANAFKSMPKLKKVVIGKNVTVIGKKAFYGDKRLKTIQVKAAGLKKVGKLSLKNIAAKAVIKVPASKKKAYTKLFKNKGQKKTVKIK